MSFYLTKILILFHFSSQEAEIIDDTPFQALPPLAPSPETPLPPSLETLPQIPLSPEPPLPQSTEPLSLYELAILQPRPCNVAAGTVQCPNCDTSIDCRVCIFQFNIPRQTLADRAKKETMQESKTAQKKNKCRKKINYKRMMEREKSIEKAIESVKNGTLNTSSAAKKFNIPRQTLADRVKKGNYAALFRKWKSSSAIQQV